ncbi:MAG: helix-turn-helix domain-containing protein [Alphaproteobacteria bacterium]|nr:helix-turn-helix domain-containing protein [Alphaproteobacteria bacterium]
MAFGLGIAWLLESDVTVPPYGLGGAFAPWTDDDARIRKLDGRTFLPEREAAAVVGLSYRTLSRYRVTGGGPPFHKFGCRVLYARFDLEAWIEARLRPRLVDAA